MKDSCESGAGAIEGWFTNIWRHSIWRELRELAFSCCNSSPVSFRCLYSVDGWEMESLRDGILSSERSQTSPRTQPSRRAGQHGRGGHYCWDTRGKQSSKGYREGEGGVEAEVGWIGMAVLVEGVAERTIFVLGSGIAAIVRCSASALPHPKARTPRPYSTPAAR